MNSIMLQTHKMSIAIVAVTLALGLSLTGCDSTSNNGDTSSNDVTLQFATSDVSSSNFKATSSNQYKEDDDKLSMKGSNGELVINDLRFIVEEFELERADGECEDAQDGNEDKCEEFEAEAFFVDLPLSGDTLDLDTSSIEAGQYEELDFEVDNLLDDDDGNSDKQSLANEVRGEFPDWPEEGSMVITGDFITSQGDTTSFKTFAEAEIEMEMEFEPPFEVGEKNVNKLLRVNIDPQSWFMKNDGTVRDLSQYDYEETGETLEFEVEIENGFEGVEVDDSDFDD